MTTPGDATPTRATGSARRSTARARGAGRRSAVRAGVVRRSAVRAGAGRRSAVTAGVVIAAVAVAVLMASPPAAAWRRPVPGAVARPFAYSPAEPFAAGRHRGVDLSARPGAVVRAACTGRVAFGGRDVVTLRCGPWRVTHLPLTGISVRAGERVRAGARIGTLAASPDHAGLHLGARRAGDRFGYVDPLPFLGGAKPPVTMPPPRTGPKTRPAAPASVPRTAPGAPVPAASPAGAPLSSPARAPLSARAPGDRVRVSPDRRVAPWPVWIGLGLALSGAIGGGIRVRVRNRRPVPESVAS